MKDNSTSNATGKWICIAVVAIFVVGSIVSSGKCYICGERGNDYTYGGKKICYECYKELTAPVEKVRVTCSFCNGTGQLKYYYGDRDNEYNWGPCTSCDEKGYTMMTPSGDSNGGKIQFAEVAAIMLRSSSPRRIKPVKT